MRSIQGLRALAALLVVCDHVPRLEIRFFRNGGFLHGFGAAGAIGVDLFFVISGFIMVTTTWKAFGVPGASNAFLARRFLRIYPAYWVAFAAFLAIGVLFPLTQNIGPMTFSSVATSALLIPARSGPLMFVAWSLEFELYFYVIFAIALYFPKSRLPLLLGLWLITTLVLNVAAHKSDLVVVQFLGSPLALEFMGGCGIGYLLLHKKIFAPRALLAVGAAIALGVAIYSSRFDGFPTLDLAWFRVLAAGPAMMLIVYGSVALEQRSHVEPPRFLSTIGDASYTMYLWHGMMLGAYSVVYGHLHLHGRIGDALFLFGAFVVVVVGSLLLYRVIELPLTLFVKRLFRVGNSPRPAAVPSP
jgi:exopolysaccharide production protein ExoZ